jgi:hypothetical protein
MIKTLESQVSLRVDDIRRTMSPSSNTHSRRMSGQSFVDVEVAPNH